MMMTSYAAIPTSRHKEQIDVGYRVGEGLEQARRRRPVYYLMIHGDREADPLLEDDRPARARGGARHDGVHAEDGHLGSVEHRRERLDAEGAEVAHCEGPAGEFVRIDVSGLAGRGEALGLHRYLPEREEIG